MVCGTFYWVCLSGELKLLEVEEVLEKECQRDTSYHHTPPILSNPTIFIICPVFRPLLLTAYLILWLQYFCYTSHLEKLCQRDTSDHHTAPIIYLSNILTISLFTPCNILPLIDPQKFWTKDWADAVWSFQKHSFLQSFWIQIIWINW